MKKDNHGFTLVELIVCVVILSIVFLAAFGFMTAGARSYTTVQARIDLQFQSQLALNQMGYYLGNANVGVNYSNDKLYIVSADDGSIVTKDTACKVQVFALSGGKLTYGSSDPGGIEPIVTDGQYTLNLSCINTSDLVTANVTNFSVTLTPADANATVKEINSAEIRLTLQNGNATYTATQTVALRNAPQLVTLS